MRRVAVVLLSLSVLSVGVTAGPAAAAKDKKDKAKSASTKKIKNCKKDKNLDENIQAAFATFFTGATTADKMATVENGDKIAPIVEEGARVAREKGQTTAGTTTYPVEVTATCDGKKNASFKYDLALNLPLPVSNPPSTGIGLDFIGDAVLVKGKWMITGETVCDLVGRNPNTPNAGPQCLAAIA